MCAIEERKKKTLPKDSDDNDRMCFGNDHVDSLLLFYTTHTHKEIIIINVHHILGFRWLVVQFNDAIFFWLDGFEWTKTKQKK